MKKKRLILLSVCYFWLYFYTLAEVQTSYKICDAPLKLNKRVVISAPYASNNNNLEFKAFSVKEAERLKIIELEKQASLPIEKKSVTKQTDDSIDVFGELASTDFHVPMTMVDLERKLKKQKADQTKIEHKKAMSKKTKSVFDDSL